MTKEEVLQKVNDYCNEKSYTNATLTDAFKDKFADHFQKANADADITDEAIIASMKFSINTAFSSASEIATLKTSAFTSKENDYKTQIAELQKKVQNHGGGDEKVVELPEDVKNQLKELQSFKDAQSKLEKFGNILTIAKDGIRQDLHESFDEFAKDYDVQLDKDDKTQAEALVQKFQSIFKASIGDIKPRKPMQNQKQDEDYISSLPKISVS